MLPHLQNDVLHRGACPWHHLFRLPCEACLCVCGDSFALDASTVRVRRQFPIIIQALLTARTVPLAFHR
jgi:hypothetical protein